MEMSALVSINRLNIQAFAVGILCVTMRFAVVFMMMTWGTSYIINVPLQPPRVGNDKQINGFGTPQDHFLKQKVLLPAAENQEEQAMNYPSSKNQQQMLFM